MLRRRPARRSSRRDRERVRADRVAGGGAGRDAASTVGRALPDLRGAGGRAGAGGGARHAVRPAAACGGDVSEDLPGAVLRAAAGGLVGPVRSHPQPGRADEPASARAKALPLRSRGRRVRPAPGRGGRIGRDGRAHRGQQRLPLGLPFGRGGRPPGFADAGRRRGAGDDGRPPARGVDLGSLHRTSPATRLRTKPASPISPGTSPMSSK